MMKFFGGKNDPPASQDPELETGPGLFARMKQAVSRTRESLSSKIEGIAALTRVVDEQAFEDLESALLTSDLGVQTTTTVLDALRDRALRKAIEGGDELRDLLKAQLQAILEAPQREIPTPADTPQGHLPRRRQRHRQNHHQRQARRLEPRARPLRPPLRRRHLPRRRHRAA